MAVIQLSILVTDLVDVMSRFDRIKVYRSITGISGTYTEITISTTRIPLVVEQNSYTYLDTTGDEAYYYKLSYYNTITTLESSLSEPQAGEDTTALGVLTVEELKSVYLPGIDLTTENGTSFNDLMYVFCIKSAVARLERELDIPIRPIRYVDEVHDYNIDDYSKHVWMQTKHKPILDVEAVKMYLPAQQLVQTFPSDWLNIEYDSGQINIIPGSGQSTTLFLANGFWGPTFWGWGKFLPDVFRITYTAGFLYGRVPYDIKNCVGMMAAITPLLSAGELILGPGIASNSLSIDGLSQSLSSMASSGGGAYQARCKLYLEEIEKQIKNLRAYYTGISFEVL